MCGALDAEQSQRSVSVLHALGLEPRRSVPAVGDELRLAVVSGDDGGVVCFGEGPVQGKVLQVPGASAGDGDVLTFS